MIVYQDELSTIYNADCRSMLSGLPKFDLVCTDPPYGIGFQSKYRSYKFSRIAGDNAFDAEVVKALVSMSRVAAYVFIRWDKLAEIPKPKSFIVWAKNNWGMGDLKHEYARQWEGIAYYKSQEHEWSGKRPRDVINCDRVHSQTQSHPTEKPVDLIREILSHSKGETVLDPYMGTGSTWLAARSLGMHFTGIEICKEYCETALERYGSTFPTGS